MIQRGDFYYCGYCDSVIYGKPNKQWLPSLAKSEKLPPGFHTT